MYISQDPEFMAGVQWQVTWYRSIPPLFAKMLGASGRAVSGLVKSVTKAPSLPTAVKANLPSSSTARKIISSSEWIKC